MSVYLLDKPAGENGIKIAAFDPQAKIVLLKDGVYIDVENISSAVYALKNDVEARGLSKRLPSKVRLINYPDLVDLIVNEKVVNFA